VVAIAGLLYFVAATPANTGRGSLRPTVTCWGQERTADDYTIVYTRRLVVTSPRTCSLLGPHVDDADGAILHNLTWRSWGAQTATAAGNAQSIGANGPGEPTEYPATVSVTGIQARYGRRWYSRMTVKSRGYTNHYRLSSPWAPDYERFQRERSPSSFSRVLQGFPQWARLDSNQRPTDYESAALTN
jgi:hypothetical protein